MPNSTPLETSPTTHAELTGANLIGGQWVLSKGAGIEVSSRLDGTSLFPVFHSATSEDVARAARSAAEAFAEYSGKPADDRAAFLEAIASQIEALGASLLERAHRESGLPMARLTGERGRTCGQLRMFAQLIREGSWVDARIDHADPARTPPRPDIRRMLVALGPVAVFGASNFPLAFSTAGGDTASALAAGCPVVFKAHPAHPGTCEYVARAIAAAAEETGMPEGVFSMVHGGVDAGQALVKSEAIAAVAFTGSQKAGRALYDLAAARPNPIPVFAEMGSVNPVFLFAGALAERGEGLAKSYSESLTMGVGQFCTNPGVVVGPAGEGFERFLSEAGSHLREVTPGLMLTDAICDRFAEGRAGWANRAELREVYAGSAVEGRATPALYATTGEEFLSHPELAEEVFGPGAIAIACASVAETIQVARALGGQLTATIQMAPSDEAASAELLPILTQIAGRVLFNGFPTGVEVCASMQHGGPYPSTTDSRSTSVGTAAIFRFARPVAFQNVPDALLPLELQESNPRGIQRFVDGQWVSRTIP